MKVPLTDCCSRGGTLKSRDDAESPKVDEYEGNPKPPGPSVDDEKALRGGNVSSEENASKHSHPEPSPANHGRESTEAQGEQCWIRSQDPTTEF